MKKTSIILSLLISTNLSFAFDLNNVVNSAVDSITKSEKNKNISSNLDNSTISTGLKEALKNGVNFAVNNLSKENGYLNNPLVKIPLPDNLAKIETIIRKAGGEKVMNNLINSMNKAATNAAPKTADIFVNAIDKMSIDDAKNILSGGKDSATNYFKTNTTESLKKLIKPIIQKTMQENQVAKYYDMANSFYKSNLKGTIENTKAMDLAKNFGVDSYIPNSDKNLDDYVTDNAISGLFKMIGEKEAKIRNNPIEQTTSILKKVFGN